MSQTSKKQTVNMLFKLKDKKTHNSLKNHKMADFLEKEAITDKKQNK